MGSKTTIIPPPAVPRLDDASPILRRHALRIARAAIADSVGGCNQLLGENTAGAVSRYLHDAANWVEEQALQNGDEQGRIAEIAKLHRAGYDAAVAHFDAAYQALKDVGCTTADMLDVIDELRGQAFDD